MKVWEVTGYPGGSVCYSTLIQAYARSQAIQVFKSIHPGLRFRSFSVEVQQ